MKKMIVKILYIEDDPILIEIVRNYIEEYISEFYSADSGEKGIELFKDKRPDIVLVDLKMPVIDGFEVKRTINKNRKNKKNIQIIGVSSTDDLYVLEKVINEEFDNFLLKPFTKEKLYSVIKKSYDRIKEQEELEEYRESLEKLVQQRTLKYSEMNKELEEEIKIIKIRKIFQEKLLEEKEKAEKKIRENGSNIPVIAISAYAFENNIKKEIEGKIDDYIMKPIKKKELINKIERIIHEKGY